MSFPFRSRMVETEREREGEEEGERARERSAGKKFE
jgi:hypothetical protein